MPSPTVSVVLPTHDRPEWLEAALRSALDGEFRDLEVVVSNNGDPEHTRRLGERIDDPRVRWIEREPCGALENFLTALEAAQGRYVAVLHDDDWWDPRFLATLVPRLEAEPGTVVAFCDHWLVDADGKVDHVATEAKTTGSKRSRLTDGYYRPFHHLAIWESIPLPACVFRREALPPEIFPPEVATAMDTWMNYQLALTGGGAYASRERLVFYRIHEGSDHVASTMRNQVAAAECQRRMLGEPQFAPHRKELHWHMAARRQSIGAALLRQGEREPARAYLSAALRLDPSPKAFAAWAATWVAPRSVLVRL